MINPDSIRRKFCGSTGWNRKKYSWPDKESRGEAGSGKTKLKNVCVNIIKYENGEFSIIDFNLEPWEFDEKYPV